MDLKKTNERLEESENTPLSEENWYKTNKLGDWLIDKLPYGCRVYFKYEDIKLWGYRTYQRIRYGVSDMECWNLDITLGKFILPRLKHFKKMNRYCYVAELTPEEWENVIDELIWTFEYLIDDEQLNPYPFAFAVDGEKLNFNREKTPEEKDDLDKWFEKNRELEERKQKGLQLFAKYYCHLGD